MEKITKYKFERKPLEEKTSANKKQMKEAMFNVRNVGDMQDAIVGILDLAYSRKPVKFVNQKLADALVIALGRLKNPEMAKKHIIYLLKSMSANEFDV